MKLWLYLLKKYVLTCVVAYVSLLFFFSVFEFAEFVRIVAQAGREMALVWEMTGWNLFVLSNEVGPLALLLSIVLFGANLARRGEIVAIFGAGVSPWTLITPIALVTAVFATGLFLISDRLAPRGLARNQQISIEELHRGTRKDYFFGKQRHWYRSGDKFVRVGDVDAQAQRYNDVTVLDVRDGHLQARYSAERVVALGSELLGEQVRIEKFPLGEDQIVRSDEAQMLLPTARHFNAFLDMSSRPQRMVLEHLKVASDTRRRQGYDPRAYEAEYHARIWFPFTVLALVLLGTTFALAVDVKRSFVRALVELLALALGAFIVRQIFRSLAGGGLLHPMVGAMGPCIVFLLYAWRRAQRTLGIRARAG